MRFPAASSAKVTISGHSGHSRSVWASSSSPRTTASINASTDFAVPGFVRTYVPGQGPGRRFAYFDILSPEFPIADG